MNEEARTLLAEPANQLVLSVASAWEIAINVSIGKLRLPAPIETFIPEQIRQDGIELLPVELRHAL